MPVLLLIGQVSNDEFQRIVKLLVSIEPHHDACNALYRTKFFMWENKLAQIFFKQYLDNWSCLSETDKQRIIFFLNRVRLDHSISHEEFMSVLSEIRCKYLRSGCQDTSHLMSLCEDLYYKRFSIHEAKEIIFGCEYREWLDKFNKLKLQQLSNHEPRTMAEVLEIVYQQVTTHAYKISEEEFLVIKEEALHVQEQLHKFDESPQVTVESPLVDKDQSPQVAVEKQLDDEEQSSWIAVENPLGDKEQSPQVTVEKQLDGKEQLSKATDFFKGLQNYDKLDEKLLWLAEHRVDFVVHLVKVWTLVAKKSGKMQTPYNTQIVSLLLFLHTNDQGLLQQVKTGEGKTLIVGMLAAAKALLGFHVDIVSSNRDLAEEGVRKCREFFKALDLEAATNCSDDDDTNQQAYKSHIVYGDVGSFQRDVLRYGKQSDESYFTSRYSDEMQKSCLIVDEVDNMCLDKGRNMLYISYQTPALKHLELLFLNIWCTVLGLKCEKTGAGKMLDEAVHYINAMIQSRNFFIPDYLKEFCHHKMRAWVHSAHQARFMDVDDQFVLDRKDKDDRQQKQVFIIDKQTGIEQYNMKWTSGLSQFLELKYRRALSSESLKAVFISNKLFFKRYGKALYGLTGTLGSSVSQKLLKEVYCIGTVQIPTNRAKHFTQNKSHVAPNRREWCKQISGAIDEHHNEQPILVICDNIKQLKTIRTHLEDQELEIEIIDYARDGDDIEQRFEDQGGAMPGQVILATNKGGRGTDIKINKKSPNGLHVILTFLPENSRIEEQAFGRAARAGQRGSGSLVLHVDTSHYKSVIETFENLEETSHMIIEMEKTKREEAESGRINSLLSKSLPQLDLEETMLESFQTYRRKFEIALDGAHFLDNKISVAVKKACVDVETDRWAFWLELMRDQIQEADSEEKRKQLKNKFLEEFPCQDELTSPSITLDSNFLMMPEHCIQLGRACLHDEDFKSALTCFEWAITKGDLTGVAAMSACYCYTKIHSTPNQETNECVFHYLEEACLRLDALRQGWMASGEIAKSLSKLVNVAQFVEESENYYSEQIEEKLKVIGLHLHMLENLMGRSLEQSSFKNESLQLTEEDSKVIYQKFVDSGIICHCKVRKCWKDRKRLEPLIHTNIDSLMAEELTSFILEQDTITESDLVSLVYSSDELWDIILPLMEPVGILLEVQKIDELKLPVNIVSTWQELKTKLSDRIADIIPTDDPVYELLHGKEYEDLVSHLNCGSLYCRCARLKDDACEQMLNLELGKYEKVPIRSNDGTEDQSLRDHLRKLFEYCQENEEGLISEQMLLSYGHHVAEARKLHLFLQQHNILKSGSLSLKCNNVQELETAIKKTLCDNSSEQIKFVVTEAVSLLGEIHSYKPDKMRMSFINFYSLKDRPQDVPAALHGSFSPWHLDHFLVLEDKHSWWDWNAFAVAMIGLAQVIAGAALMALTAGAATPIGWYLINEGINDMVYATMAGIQGTFSWKSWGIQKTVSVALSVAAGGIKVFAASLKAATKIGAASRACRFTKIFGKAAAKFALDVTANIISDVLLAEVQKRVVNGIVDMIEQNIISALVEKLRPKLFNEASQHPDQFHQKCEAMRSDLQNSLGQGFALGQDFSFQERLLELHSEIVSGLKQCYTSIADKLSPSSKWAKGLKACLLADDCLQKLRNLKALEAVHIVKAIISLLSLWSSGSHEELSKTEKESTEALVDKELELIKETVHKCIQHQLHKVLNGALKNAIKKGLTEVARAGRKMVDSKMREALNGQTSSEVVESLQEDTKKDVIEYALSPPQDDGPPPPGPPPPPPGTQLAIMAEMEEMLSHNIAKPKIDEKDDKVQECIKVLAANYQHGVSHQESKKFEVPVSAFRE